MNERQQLRYAIVSQLIGQSTVTTMEKQPSIIEKAKQIEEYVFGSEAAEPAKEPAGRPTIPTISDMLERMAKEKMAKDRVSPAEATDNVSPFPPEPSAVNPDEEDDCDCPACQIRRQLQSGAGFAVVRIPIE